MQSMEEEEMLMVLARGVGIVSISENDDNNSSEQLDTLPTVPGDTNLRHLSTPSSHGPRSWSWR